MHLNEGSVPVASGSRGGCQPSRGTRHVMQILNFESSANFTNLSPKLFWFHYNVNDGTCVYITNFQFDNRVLACSRSCGPPDCAPGSRV